MVKRVLQIGLAAAVIVALSFVVQAQTVFPPAPEQSPFVAQKLEQMRAKFGPAALEFLEDISDKRAPYLPPSKIDPRFTLALYVKTNGSGLRAQRMWVLQRDVVGGPWKLALWDKRYWRRKGLPSNLTPPYSWPVSTGRHYRGDPKSGPTPRGVFSLDERKYRSARGYTAPGMINVMYIDYHYSSGRRSGVAFHGTTRGRYRRLGRIDSHGCIRMTQANALALLNRVQGRDGVLDKDMHWGEVPRYWRSQRRGRRFGYTRDGSVHLPVEAALEQVVSQDGEPSGATFTNDADKPFPPALTKQGYRAIAIIFAE